MKVAVLKKAQKFPTITPKFKGKLERELRVHEEKIELIRDVLQKDVAEDQPQEKPEKSDTDK